MFVYNENLVQERNDELMTLVSTIGEDAIKRTVLDVMKDEITIEGLKAEFSTSMPNINWGKPVSGENIKNYFAITINGTNKVWDKITSKFFKKAYPLYENVLEYLDEVLDALDFDELYKNELKLLNG